jgi:hypothetical protein
LPMIWEPIGAANRSIPMLISLLIAVIVLGLLLWLVQLLPLPDPFKTIALVIVVLICILWLVGGYGGPILPHCAGRFC